MSPSSMSAKDRRALYIGLGVILPALLFIWGVKPLLAKLSDTRHDIIEQRELLANEEAAVAAPGTLHFNPAGASDQSEKNGEHRNDKRRDPSRAWPRGAPATKSPG